MGDRRPWCAVGIGMGLTAALLACGAEEVRTGQTPDTGAASTASAGSAPPAGVSAIAYCDSVPELRPDRDGGQSGPSNIDPVLQGVLNGYTAKHPDTFAGLWIARASGGTVTLAFTDDPAVHLAAIEALRPGPDDVPAIQPPPSITATTSVGESGFVVDVVQAQYSEAQLRSWQEQMFPKLRDLGLSGAGSGVTRNRVGISFDRDVDLAEVAARLDGVLPLDAVCIDGQDPSSPVSTLLRPATLIPPEGSDPLVTCMSATGTVAQFTDGIPIADDDPLMVAFRQGGTIPGLPETGAGEWYLVQRTDDRATFLLGHPPTASVGMEYENDRWIWAGGSAGSGNGCPPYEVVGPDGVGEADWVLDPAFPAPGPADTELHVLVTERACAGGTLPGDRLVGPEVVERGDQVLIGFGVRVQRGAHTCQGNPSTPVTVTLGAPLGSRTIADGTTLPPTPASELSSRFG